MPKQKDSPKLIVITGATDGIGRALSLEFARMGHRVIGCGRDPEKILTLRLALDSPHAVYRIDVTQGKQVDRFSQIVLKDHGVPDVLINNAGCINDVRFRGRDRFAWEIPEAEFRKVIDTNLIGIANMVRCFAPAMVGKHSGAIVNMSSTWGKVGLAGLGAYCASKGGLERFTEVLAAELPSGVTAVCYNPGQVRTNMHQNTWKGPKQRQGLDPGLWARFNAPRILDLRWHHSGTTVMGMISKTEEYQETRVVLPAYQSKDSSTI